jgi:maleamate amidohydrolase
MNVHYPLGMSKTTDCGGPVELISMPKILNHTARSAHPDEAIYAQQGFGGRLVPTPPYALVIVDFVVGFTDPNQFGGGNIVVAIERTRTALENARKQSWPVAHTRIVFAEDGSDANIFSRKVPPLASLTENALAGQIVPELKPVAGELVVRKTLPSGFANTGLQAWLTQRAVRSVAIAGCTTSGCVRATVLDAMNAGFLPFVLRDCVGDRAIDPHQANLFDLAQKYAEVLDLADFLAVSEKKREAL